MSRAVFISHSSEQAALAKSLCERLESHGNSCWMAPRDVIPGQPYAAECVRGIEESEAFLLLASAAAIASSQVLSEVEQAHKRRKPIYTVLIGKPNIPRELDYYISRLHWIESGTGSMEDLADRLTGVLAGSQSWQEVASPPSLRRMVLYRRDAFVGSAAATALVLLLAATGVGFWAKSRLGALDRDFRRLGYISLTGQQAAGDAHDIIHVQAQVWLAADGVRFGDVTFTAAAVTRDGSVDRVNHSSLLNPEQIGGVQIVDFAIPSTADRVTACLSVPNAGLKERSRVTQTFSVPAVSQVAYAVDLPAVTQPQVTRDDNGLCGGNQ
jgi:TIR domain-containing protein